LRLRNPGSVRGVVENAYEATLCAAVHNAQRGASNIPKPAVVAMTSFRSAFFAFGPRLSFRSGHLALTTLGRDTFPASARSAMARSQDCALLRNPGGNAGPGWSFAFHPGYEQMLAEVVHEPCYQCRQSAAFTAF
jgi:hypothetical protein